MVSPATGVTFSTSPRPKTLCLSLIHIYNGMGTTEALDLTAGYPPGTRKVVLGPWQHSGNLSLIHI